MDLELTQRELAAVLKVDKSTVYNWENGPTKPHPRTEKQLRDFLTDSQAATEFLGGGNGRSQA